MDVLLISLAITGLGFGAGAPLLANLEIVERSREAGQTISLSQRRMAWYAVASVVGFVVFITAFATAVRLYG